MGFIVLHHGLVYARLAWPTHHSKTSWKAGFINLTMLLMYDD